MKKGFTLIEILVAVLLIAILAGAIVVSVASNKKNANAARLKQSLAGIKNAIAICCTNPSNLLFTSAGASICNDGTISSKLPTYQHYGLSNSTNLMYTVTAPAYNPIHCGRGGSMNVTISNHPKTECNSIYTVTASSVKYGALYSHLPAPNQGFPPGC